jgi:hypothetical protein
MPLRLRSNHSAASSAMMIQRSKGRFHSGISLRDSVVRASNLSLSKLPEPVQPEHLDQLHAFQE